MLELEKENKKLKEESRKILEEANERVLQSKRENTLLKDDFEK